MARAISDEELQLQQRAKRRLIGAVVLVAAVVVVLPMVLDSEPAPTATQEISIEIPSPDAGAFVSKVAPISGPAQDSAAPAVPAAPGDATFTGKADVPQETASKPPVSKPAPKRRDGPFVIQVIALADAGKAKEMQQRIAAAGIQSYTEVVKTAKGEVTRVRVGPFATRGAAEKAREQLKALGLTGNISAR